MTEEEAAERMRAEWNERAREDAHYYVAFGRRDQDSNEFFATGADVLRGLEAELRRFPPGPLERALEVGCGPGRLMRPMSQHFHQIYGVDVSDEMIRRAEANLSGIGNAHALLNSGADLSQFPAAYFDFVYSYAVFQHIPSRDVVFSYFAEIVRVLKPGGIARLQINGLPRTARQYTTWEGARIEAGEVREFARAQGLLLMALEGAETQYLWTTWAKPTWSACRVSAIVSAHTGEPAIPARGPLAFAAIWLERLPPGCDLNSLSATIDGKLGTGYYLGPERGGLSQFNVLLPEGTRAGLVPVDVTWRGEPLCPTAWMRAVPPGPAVPRVCSVTDGVNLLSSTRVESGTAKIVIEEITSPEAFEAMLDGRPVMNTEWFCADPLHQRYEFNFRLPEGTSAGPHELRMRLGSREFSPRVIEVA